MTTIKFPNHMRAALDAALKEFNENGFSYNAVIQSTDGDNKIDVAIDANNQELVNLGVKVGYKLALETSHPVS